MYYFCFLVPRLGVEPRELFLLREVTLPDLSSGALIGGEQRSRTPSLCQRTEFSRLVGGPSHLHYSPLTVVSPVGIEPTSMSFQPTAMTTSAKATLFLHIHLSQLLQSFYQDV